MKRVLVALACLGLAAPAMAQQGSLPTQQFAPAPGGDNNYVTVQGSGVLPAWRPAVGLYLNYAHDPLLLRNTATDERVSLIEHQLQLDLIAAFGFLGFLELGIAVPITLFQQEGEGDGTLQPNAVGSFVMGDIRLYPKWSILHDPEGAGLALLAVVTLPSGSPSDLQGNEGVTLEPRLVFQYAINEWFRFAASGGFVWRPEAQSLFNINVGNEVTFGAGVEYKFDPGNFALIGEGYGKISIESEASAESNPIEVALAGRWWPARHHALTLGVARGLTVGYGAPNFRVFLGYNYTPKPDEPYVETRNPDTDGDGFCDPWVNAEGRLGEYSHICTGVDLCPQVPGIAPDGCPEPDRDGDGVCDPWVSARGMSDHYAHICSGVDLCPDEPGELPHGCPNPDRDGDGVCDPWVSERGMGGEFAHICTGVDRCPDEPGLPPDGCPEEPDVEVNPCEIVITDKVNFRYASHELEENSFPLLNAVARVLQEHDWILKVEVQGHTDTDGGRQYNLELSQNRANEVLKYLVNRGVDTGRLQARGYGFDRPIASNATAEGRAQNRRVQFIILDPPQEDCN